MLWVSSVPPSAISLLSPAAFHVVDTEANPYLWWPFSNPFPIVPCVIAPATWGFGNPYCSYVWVSHRFMAVPWCLLFCICSHSLHPSFLLWLLGAEPVFSLNTYCYWSTPESCSEWCWWGHPSLVLMWNEDHHFHGHHFSFNCDELHWLFERPWGLLQPFFSTTLLASCFSAWFFYLLLYFKWNEFQHRLFVKFPPVGSSLQ